MEVHASGLLILHHTPTSEFMKGGEQREDHDQAGCSPRSDLEARLTAERDGAAHLRLALDPSPQYPRLSRIARFSLVRYKNQLECSTLTAQSREMPATPKATEVVKATSRMLRAGWHPIQIQAQTILTERIASPKEIALELGLPAAKAGYVSGHIKELEKRGLVELVRTERRHSANERFYRATEPLIVADDEAERMSFEERLILSCWIIARMSGDFLQAVEAGTIDERTDRHLSRFPMRLDEEGYLKVIEVHRRVFNRTLEIDSASRQRLTASREEGKPISAMLACFPMPGT